MCEHIIGDLLITPSKCVMKVSHVFKTGFLMSMMSLQVDRGNGRQLRFRTVGNRRFGSLIHFPRETRRDGKRDGKERVRPQPLLWPPTRGPLLLYIHVDILPVAFSLIRSNWWCKEVDSLAVRFTKLHEFRIYGRVLDE